MQVDRLRLVGFKSFVEATELAIEPGLTGIVGPNGCGKSNLVEALRWVMGESSAKRLRGGEMDDVIFGGSAGRPARNLAEVALTIDNSARDAPFAVNDREEIEVVRRILRGSGSSFRINGRESRARDVQLLFADAATGPHSGALVSQGRIGALVAARPQERRVLLDEAAGTAGLHARRHEAELKLKAAEENLLRLDDIVATMASQLESLKKQARQAQRYRRLADEIRRTEALLFRARWAEAEAAAFAYGGQIRAAERQVAEAGAAALKEAREAAEAEAALPPLRERAAAASAAVQRLAHAREALEHELQRVLAARDEVRRRLGEVAADLRREAEHRADAEAALARLAAEEQSLAREAEESGPAQHEAATRRDEAAASLARSEAALQRLTEQTASDEARRAALVRRRAEIGERRARLQARQSEAERERAGVARTLVAAAETASAAAAVVAAERQAAESRAASDARRQAVERHHASEARAVERARELERGLARLSAEAEALDALLAAEGSDAAISGRASLLSSMRVAEGFEAAVGALFDDELAAPLLNEDAAEAPCGWVTLPPLTATGAPAGAHELAAAVEAPAALGRRLAQAFWVESAAAGWQAQPALAAGQRLVDRDGRLWRWDGFVRLKESVSATAQHLRQRNRRAALAAEIAGLEPAWRKAAEDAAAAQRERQAAIAAERAAADGVRAADTALARARAEDATLARRALAAETRLAALADAARKLAIDLAEAMAQDEEAERSLAQLPEPGRARAELAAAREAVAAARRGDGEARAAIDRLTRAAEGRRQRRAAIDLESRAWRKRGDGSAQQQGALDARRQAIEAELESLARRPDAIAADSAALARESGAAALRDRQAADALAAGETARHASGTRAREAQRAEAGAREERARLTGLDEAATAALARLREEIAERVDAAPEALAELAGLAAGAEPPPAAENAARLERLLRERDGMGPVNLVAESEAEAVEARVAELRSERAELTEAIARLRRGIGALDHEARKRLLAAFERLNDHFATLFPRLFGGGEGHLELVDASDPLSAGLEIMASPPGKRLQALSLLSGGEQALTASALLFAVFLTNPAPVCVLDEVDAPLDDANVDRLCAMLAETADATGTRFLVVTHHRVTMARMDRLFGVTMRERGISQLVSVELARAAELRRTA